MLDRVGDDHIGKEASSMMKCWDSASCCDTDALSHAPKDGGRWMGALPRKAGRIINRLDDR
jgi:hypothetical protein